jgi:hypothetical protein
MNPSAPLDVALVGCTPGSTNCDPAINLAAPGVAAKLTAYERSRSAADRDALPRHPDMRLALFRLAPLTSAGVRVVTAESGPRRAQYAVQVACHELVDAAGATHKAADHGGLQAAGKLSIASDEWLDFIADAYGHKAINELAAIILLRAEAGPNAVAPFGLPLGLMLAR